MFFISGIRILSPSANQGVDQTERELPFPIICLRFFTSNSLPKKILFQAKEGLEPVETDIKEPFEKYLLLSKRPRREGVD